MKPAREWNPLALIGAGIAVASFLWTVGVAVLGFLWNTVAPFVFDTRAVVYGESPEHEARIESLEDFRLQNVARFRDSYRKVIEEDQELRRKAAAWESLPPELRERFEP